MAKVTPSTAARSLGGLGGRDASAPVGGSLGLSGQVASNGIELMVGEVEEFATTYRSTKSLAEVEDFFSTLAGMCVVSVPEITMDLQVLVTNYRIILRERHLMKEPGFTNCCYYAACLCCCGTEGENGFEEQLFIDRRDIKDVRFKISHAELRSTCLGCPCSVDKNESFMAKLYLTRWAGETRHGWINWAIDKDLKTYARNVNLAGIMDSKRSMELRKVLHAVACQNANAGAPPPPPPVVALLGGSQPPYSSQPPYGQQSPYGQQQPYSQQVIQRPYSQQVSQRQSTAAATAATTTGGLVGTQQAVTEPLITETITEPVAQQTMMQ